MTLVVAVLVGMFVGMMIGLKAMHGLYEEACGQLNRERNKVK